jgi:peptide-methionine (S)-S-oxide reductase
VSSGATGHAEAVEITYDPSKITYGQLLQIYFSVAHNPTQLNYQGPDHGTQYRSEIFTTNETQAEVAKAYIAQLDAAKAYEEPIVTQVNALEAFFPAEDYHQDYATLHPDQPYIAYHDLPKIENLKQLFPEVYRETPVLVRTAATQ